MNNQPHEESATLAELNDLDAALAEQLPDDDAPVESIVDCCNRWHAAVMLAGRKTAALAWRIGTMLRRLRPRYGYGEWERFVGDSLPGLSLTTVKRYIRLAKHFDHPPETKTLTDAYEKAEIVQPAGSRVDMVIEELDALTNSVLPLRHRLANIYRLREFAYTRLSESADDNDFDERIDMLAVYRAELQLNAELLVLKNQIETAEQTTLHRKCSHLPEWVREDLTAHLGVEPECIPDSVLTSKEKQTSFGLRRVREIDREYEKDRPPDPKPGRGFMNKVCFPDGPPERCYEEKLIKW